MSKRPGWDEYFMDMAELVRTRTTCLRRAVGAVIVKDHHVLATGYNGSPRGMRHCSETGCLRLKLSVPSGQNAELCRGLHAEQNAIIQAARMGINISGSTLYCTTQPCVICTKMIINAGIKRVVIRESYPDKLAEEMAAEAGLIIETLGTTKAAEKAEKTYPEKDK